MGNSIQQKDDLQRFFGQVLRKYRHMKGLSQEKLALESNLDRTYISLLERGKRTPSLWTLFILSKQLDISPVELVREMEHLID